MLSVEDRIDTAFFPYGPESLDGLIHNDHLGTPQKLTDSTGTVVWSADYKPFGEVNITTNTITNNLRFPGQYYDQETGTHYNYYRDYDPAIGKYKQADPLLSIFTYKSKSYFVVPFIIRTPGQFNNYAYVMNRPIVRIDSFGLAPQTPGCDGVPDILETGCRKGCCATHDKCYEDNKCSAAQSWPGTGKAMICPDKKTPCTECNQAVLDCFSDCAMKDTMGGYPKQIEIPLF